MPVDWRERQDVKCPEEETEKTAQTGGKDMPDTSETKAQPLTMTVLEYCEETGFAPSTVYAAIGRGELAHVRMGKAIRLPRWVLNSLKEPK